MPEKKEHVHAELLRAFADDSSLQFECRFEENGKWQDCSIPSFFESTQYRIKPKIVKKYRYVICTDDNYTFLTNCHLAENELKDSHQWVQRLDQTMIEVEE